MASNDLDPGFEEVSLDPGFQEVPIKPTKSSVPINLSDYGGGDVVSEATGQPESTKTAQAFGTGALKGATFGFNTDVGAAGDIAKDVATGKQGISGLQSKFREYQKQRAAANDALQKEESGAFLAGELGGGLATMLIPGAGEATGGSALLRAASKIPGAAKFLAGATPEAIAIKKAMDAGQLSAEAGNAALAAMPKASLLTRVAGAAASDAIQGAPVGGLIGAGYSDKSIENDPIGLLKDTVSGAATGGFFGAGVTAAAGLGAAAGSTVKNLGKDSDAINRLKSAWQFGLKNLDLGSSEMKNKLALLPIQNAGDLTDNIIKARKYAGTLVGNAVDDAEKAGITFNVDPEIEKTAQNIFGQFIKMPNLMDLVSPDSKKIINKFYNSVDENGKIIPNAIGDLSVTEARSLKDALAEGAQKAAQSGDAGSDLAAKSANNLSSKINNLLKNTPGMEQYKDAANKFEEFNRLIPETIIDKATPSKYTGTYYSDLKNKENKLFTSSQDVLKRGQLEGVDVDAERGTLEQLKGNLNELQKNNPELLQRMGGTSDEIYNKLKQQSIDLAMLRHARGEQPNVDPDLFTKGYHVLSSAVTGSKAPTLGAANRSAQYINPILTTSNKLFAASNDELSRVAQVLKGNSSTSSLGSALETALGNKTGTLKTAILFRMLQDPTYRKILESNGYSEDGNQSTGAQ